MLPPIGSRSASKEVVMISGVSKVVVPVDDQERAQEFWTTRIGFEVTSDAPYEGGHWLEVTPPDGSVVLVLSRRSADEPRPEVSDMLPHSPVFFTCEDIQQTYRELSERGVKFPAPPAEMPFGWWSMFEDDEGTRYALRQG
jgi:predicted enzyme related to lactoylglutathione lyase